MLWTGYHIAFSLGQIASPKLVSCMRKKKISVVISCSVLVTTWSCCKRDLSFRLLQWLSIISNMHFHPKDSKVCHQKRCIFFQSLSANKHCSSVVCVFRIINCVFISLISVFSTSLKSHHAWTSKCILVDQT